MAERANGGSRILIGTSGWHYQHWKGLFYPSRIPTTEWLAHYAERFDTVELNNAFYRLPEKQTFENWAATVPGRFEIAVKVSRYLTHVKRLREPAEPVARLLERTQGLGGKCGPMLLQLPPDMKAEPDRLAETLAHFPKRTKVAVEARHPTWFTDSVRRVLEDRNAAWCLTDGGKEDPPEWRTADWGYLRFHRGHGRPGGCYKGQELDTWATRIARLWPAGPVYCYFNNDGHGCAPRDARRLAESLDQHGQRASRVPGRRETPVR